MPKEKTVKVKVSEATGEVLEWMILLALGYVPFDDIVAYHQSANYKAYYLGNSAFSRLYEYGGPILFQEGISTVKQDQPADNWWAFPPNQKPGDAFGSNPLIAGMRCLVMSKLGEEVEVPKRLVKNNASPTQS